MLHFKSKQICFWLNMKNSGRRDVAVGSSLSPGLFNNSTYCAWKLVYYTDVASTLGQSCDNPSKARLCVMVNQMIVILFSRTRKGFCQAQ